MWADITSAHIWIGISFVVEKVGWCVMELPPKYIAECLDLLAPWCTTAGHGSERDMITLLGKVGRVSHVVPLARPFIGALYAAYSACRVRPSSRRREAPPGQLPRRRFSTAAAWLRGLLRQDVDSPFRLCRQVAAQGPFSSPPSGWCAQFDASPWGGGATLSEGDVIKEFFVVSWREADASHLGVHPGSPKWQSFWELATLLLCLDAWGSRFVEHSLEILGDNTSALQDALDLKGRGPMLALAREIALRNAQRNLSYVVGHLPSEHNTVPDQLSRVFAPDRAAFPTHALAGAQQVGVKLLEASWLAAPM